jgi:hypothetical protein
MDATTFRRYLQPSPTLRWHPWAPLIAGLLLLAFVFHLGTRWGFRAAEHLYWESGRDMGAIDVFARHDRELKNPAGAMMHEAGRLDAAVHRYIEFQAHQGTAVENLRDRIEAQYFFHGHTLAGPNRELAMKIAELRLAEYSPANPRWQATSVACDEMHRVMRGEMNYIERYRPIAAEYSQLLGRTVRPEDLAPAVPGWKCAF